MATAAVSGSQMASVRRDLVFVSYSHRDEDWRARLLIFLEAYADLKIWADPYIRVGDQWRREIATALARSRVAVLLVSPDFLVSDFIKREELPPLLKGADAGVITLVPIPISASSYKATPLAQYQFAHPPAQPLDRMRTPRRNEALVRITEQIVSLATKATRDYQVPVTALSERLVTPLAPVIGSGDIGPLHGVPAQRPNYLRRQEYFDRVKQAVLGSTQQAIGITGATQGGRIGLHGMGGIGKTVLAIDLANDDEVRGAFADGIFWLTLGQTIEPLQLQGELAGYVVGKATAFATIDQGREQLRQMLNGKSCLLILDDLWRPQDAGLFDVLGPRSRLLVTTRDADLLGALGAGELTLGVLGEEQALELLAAWAGQDRAALPAAAAKVAASCGYLPLALAAVGGYVGAGVQG